MAKVQQLFTDCCYGTDQQHAANQPCPREEWVEWAGGECPVDPDTRIHAKVRSGYYWGPGMLARQHVWGRGTIDPRAEVIAYRVMP